VLRGALKSLAFSAHRVAASHRHVAAPYVWMFRLLRLFPDRSWKQFVINSLQSVQWPSLALPPSRVRLTSGVEVNIIPHIGEFDFAAHICCHLAYEQETISWCAGRSYDTIVEIGANIGIYTLLFSKLFPTARIYAFEPSRTAYQRLLMNLALNECRNVFTFNCAVTDRSGFADFYEPVGHLTNGSLHRSFAEVFGHVRATKVQTVGGAEVQALCGDGNRILLKIDVEAAEPIVLHALESTISSARPDIVIEVLPQVAEDLNSMNPFVGYRLLQLTQQGAREQARFVARADCRDYALIPRSVLESVPSPAADPHKPRTFEPVDRSRS
jgi:FkbM family methyltransferase